MPDQKEILEVEEPAMEVLTNNSGWTELDATEANKLRDTPTQPILTEILYQAIKDINPWISEENAQRVVRGITSLQASSVLEANESIQAMLERGTSIRQDLGDSLGLKNRDVMLIDYDRPEKNKFHVVRQFSITHYQEIIPDIALFINGLPVVVIECKSPYIRDPIEEGMRRLFRYQEMEGRFKNLGCPQLFHTVQMVVSTSRDAAKYATNLTPERHWSEWKDPYPLTIDRIAKELGRIPNPQDVFLFGACSRENILDLIRNFIVFEREDGGVIKKLAKYQQFRSVNKTLKRITGKGRKGGIIWHWQGSGKSLSMLWTAVKLRRIQSLDSPTMVVVTDRTDLDKQINDTFLHCGFPNPVKAKSSKHLKELLGNPAGQTITTTVQKFQDAAEEYPTLSENSNIFVLVDEAHRSQYKSLAANMRKGLKNACFVGFTGTPLFKKERDTFRVFGSYIDKYDHNQSVSDGVTVPIYYESRMPELHLMGNSIDQLLKRVFSDRSHEELEQIKKKYANMETIAESYPMIRAISLDLIQHYESHILPNGFKAQIVAVNRQAALRYKEVLGELNAPSSDVLISVVNDDDKEYRKFRRSKSDENELIRKFKKEADPKILIVCDKLLAGFDAPVEQVMYLHKPLKEHTLLQAMGRVNRKNANKEYGLVVDYWGVADELQTALKMYSEDGIEGLVLTDYKKEILPRLQAAHHAAMNFFREVPAQEDEVLYNEACVLYLEPEDRRVAFDQRFKLFSRYMDMLLPDPKALPYKKDLKWLSNIRIRARNRYRDDHLSLDGCSEKVRKLIDENIAVGGITQLIEPTSIFSKKFDEEVERLSSPEAKASEIEHAIKHEITVKIDENPVFYESLSARLQRIIDDYRQHRLNSIEQLKLLRDLLEDARAPDKHAMRLGLDPDVAPFYELITKDSKDKEVLKPVAEEVYATLKELTVVDWQQKEDIKRELRRQIKRLLRAASYPTESIQDRTSQIMDLAARRFQG
jgi:type I restriction enzyme, R subunit